MNNKKGFTLVELLAVIVILALIMSIAVISIGGVLDGAKKDTFKETAASIIDGVKKQLLINNALEEGNYYFYSTILDRGGKESPFGGNISYYAGTCADASKIGDGTMVCKATGTMSCSVTSSTASTSYIHIDSNKAASICLTAGAGKKYIDITHGTEVNLLNKNNYDMLKDASA